MKRKVKNEPKKRLILNVALMIFTLFTLACCVLAWFTASKTARISPLTMHVERRDLQLVNTIDPILFPCALKIDGVDSSTKGLFNNYAQSRVYEVQGEGQIYVSVDCNSNKTGMLAYVCDSVNTTDYYAEMYPKLVTEMGTKEWNATNIAAALNKINKRLIGEMVDGNTHVKIVYWVEYEDASVKLEQASYWDSDADSSVTYNAKVTFKV